MEINSICVCGAGTMGSGIAQAAAQAGFATLLYELNPVVLEKAKNNIHKNLLQLTEKGKISLAEKDSIEKRISFTDDIHHCLADVFIEAIIEKTDIKIALFNQLAELNHSECIFASNTSSLSITEIAKNVQRPDRVIGMHFFNPATIMKLVEVVNTEFTNEATTSTVVELARQMGKTPVVCKDSPGFIVNRVARPYYIESLRQAEEGGVSMEQIDAAMEAAGFKMGPFKLMDLIGNDVNYAVSCSVYEQLGRPERLKPSYIQEQKVKDGKLGKKAGEGYYPYPLKGD
ncbi:MAG TPA: 3-hydroxyacyl-CoA dehydrogenase NAD-binding domain-containing protein [Chitinophagaceae bacterium]|nr:3-hydroxyacyl-CoA dehydrogenase NAD-binding domain-containing protein [Chitinophagaceae bacterium]